MQVMSTDVITKKLFTVDEFQRMGDAGILPDGRRYELIRGEVIEMSLPGSPHAGRVKRLTWLFNRKIGDAALISVQDPVVLGLHSMPVPDIALLQPRADFYTSAHPKPEDVLLLVEVANTSLKSDRTVKAELYAEAGISEYWLLDIHGDALIVHSNPKNGSYQNVITLGRDHTVTPHRLGIVFRVDEILGDLPSSSA